MIIFCHEFTLDKDQLPTKEKGRKLTIKILDYSDTYFAAHHFFWASPKIEFDHRSMGIGPQDRPN